MTRVTTVLVIFFLAFNGIAFMLTSTGAAAAMGLGGQANVGGDDATTSLQGTADEGVPSGDGAGATLFGLFNVVTSFMMNIFGYIFPGIGMMRAAGVPDYITGFISSMAVVIIPLEGASFLVNRDI
jgi:hypothetical protein